MGMERWWHDTDRGKPLSSPNISHGPVWDININIKPSYIKIQSVPRSKHTVSVIKTSRLMVYRKIIAVCSQIHTKHINTLCGQNVEFYRAFAKLR